MIGKWAVRFSSLPSSLFPCFASQLDDATSSTHSCFAMSRSIRVAIVGDVHEQWDLEDDSYALHLLQPDLVLFTGDFGNNNVELVRSISNLKMPKAAILGNHDCMHTYRFSQKKLDPVQLQLKCLGEQHVGYNRLDFPMLNLSVLGGRPFSRGGAEIHRPHLLIERYGVNDMDSSAKKIYEAALGTPDGHFIILLAHNGPTGLGSARNDICGVDWLPGGGDHGDIDLAQAIANLKSSTMLPIPLVVFGHMHSQLQGKDENGNLKFGGDRKMVVNGTDNIIYLNGAVVPRVRRRDGSNSSYRDSIDAATLRAFTMVEILGGRVKRISETWVSVCKGKTSVEEERVLFNDPS